MTVALLLGVLGAAAVAGALLWRALSCSLYSAAALLFLLVGYGVAPRLLLHGLQDGYATEFRDWGVHNVIVVLGAGAALNDHHAVEVPLFGYGRVLKALDLYRDCRRRAADCRLVISGGDPLGNGQSEAAAYAQRLQALGVAPADLLLEPRSANTWQNAQYTAALLERSAPYDCLVLLTSGYHLRRAGQYFAHFGLSPRLVRADYATVRTRALPTAENLLMMDLALHEYVGAWRYRL
jgi:uncharacterized SAM-binding protein YcdF (DUF218 family)